ncbi:MAG: S-methyl-5-thioribose-1-phosphate isomerase [Actinomycetota bacterium]|nr:S-methyl-5-thioribose-1-phosphate isomerase [Actinomycetota bacterium]
MEWVDEHVDLIDQTALPHQRRVALHTTAEVVDAIHRMVVRGAPALGAMGALGVALAAARSAELGYDPDAVRTDARRITEARPTAAHLGWAVQQVLPAVPRGPAAVLAAAQALVDADVRACATLSRLGAALLRSYVGDRPMVLHTHCNAGAMACVEWGTALGVVRALHADALIKRVLVGETRPLLQGSRITAFELAELGVPHQVVVDSAAARAGIPFVVAAPTATIDVDTPTGSAVTIEYRDPDEVLLVGGWRMAPVESGALNPAFDVTPADLVTAIVTEARVIEPARPTASTGVGHAVPMGVAHAVTVPAMRMVGAS